MVSRPEITSDSFVAESETDGTEVDYRVPADERLLNLFFYLLSVSNDDRTKKYLTKEQIFNNVEGYREAGRNEAAMIRLFERDKERIRSWGIPISQGPESAPESEQGYCLNRSDVELTPMEFSAEEQLVLSVARQIWASKAQSEITYTALAKISDSGEMPSTEAVSLFSTNINLDFDEDDLAKITLARSQNQIVGFRYRDKIRRVAPWQVITRWGAWYLFGMDLDMASKRIYKLNRIQGKIEIIPLARLKNKYPEQLFKDPSEAELEVLRKEFLHAENSMELVLAVYQKNLDILPKEFFQVLADLGETKVKNYFKYRVQLRSWRDPVQVILSLGKQVVVLEPQELREEIKRQLADFQG